VGGEERDQANACAFDPSTGELVVAGTFRSPTIQFGTKTVSKDNPLCDQAVFVAKLDANGSAIWAQALLAQGVNNLLGTMTVGDVAVGPDGTVAIAGTISGHLALGADSIDSTGQVSAQAGYLVALRSSDGSYAWHDVFGAAIFLIELQDDRDGNWAIDGDDIPATAPVMRLAASSAGVVLTATYGKELRYAGVPHTPGGSPVDFGAFVARYELEGMPLWQRFSKFTQGGVWQYAVAVTGLALDGAGRSYLSGFARCDEFGFGTTPVKPYGGGGAGEDPFLVILDEGGTDTFAMAWGDVASQRGDALALGNELLLAGSFAGAMNMGGGTVVAPSCDGQTCLKLDAFAARFGTDGQAPWRWSDSWGAFNVEYPLLHGTLDLRAGLDHSSNMVLAGRLTD
jgi:hypothetical protein